MMQKVYSPLSIKIGTFLGGPLAGAYLMSKNFETLENKNMARKAMFLGYISTLVFIFLLLALPGGTLQKIPGILYPFVFLGIAHFATEQYQKHDIEEFALKGGIYYSNWKASGISLLFALAFVIVLIQNTFFV